MARLDPRMQLLRQQGANAQRSDDAKARLGVTEQFMGAADPEVRVLVEVKGDLAIATQAGLRVTSRAGDVAAGFVALSAIDALRELSVLGVVECSRPMSEELNLSCADIRADAVHRPPTALTGTNVIVGLIDSGIDFTHPSFYTLLPDGVTKQTRILAIWDQYLVPRVGESSPLPYGFGVEYTQAQINAVLNATPGATPVRHKDRDASGHGTHVACIAAGGPSAAAGAAPAGFYTGIAPDADIIVVANRTTPNMATSANTLDAVIYLLAFATARNKPIVINQSQGDYLGPHDGTSLLERGIDKVLVTPGQAMIKSAGNAAEDRAHAKGTVKSASTTAVALHVPPGHSNDAEIDLWYAGVDSFDVTVRVPGGATSATVSPGTIGPPTMLPNGNRIFIESSVADPFNGDNRIFIQLFPGTLPSVQSGRWEIVLKNRKPTTSKEFNIWIGRDRVMPEFLPPHLSSEMTISIPGTAKSIITAGAYVTNAALRVGDFSVFSSRGPSRDGRSLPTLCAPGETINSARVGTPTYHALAGTSMAAPHVTGTVALMLQKCRSLTQGQIAMILRSSARTDAYTGATPAVNQWGTGKLDAERAVATTHACP